MDDFELQTPLNALKALSHFVDVSDIRTYLHGVHVEIFTDRARLVAVNGVSMGIYRLDCGSGLSGPRRLTIPVEAVKRLSGKGNVFLRYSWREDRYTLCDAGAEIKFNPVDGKFPDYRRVVLNATSGKGNVFLRYSWRKNRYTLCDAGAEIKFNPVDVKFPDYRRVVLNATSGKTGHFDPKYLAQFSAAAKALGKKCIPVLHQNGEDAAYVTLPGEDKFFGVLMPLRRREVSATQTAPTWVFE